MFRVKCADGLTIGTVALLREIEHANDNTEAKIDRSTLYLIDRSGSNNFTDVAIKLGKKLRLVSANTKWVMYAIDLELVGCTGWESV